MIALFLAGCLVAGSLSAQSAAELVGQARNLEGEAAVSLLRKAVALDDAYAAAHYMLGRKLLGVKQYAEAEKHFSRAVSRISNNDPKAVRRAKALALAGSGVALFEQKKLDAAERRLKESLAEDPTQEAEDLLTRIRQMPGRQMVSAASITRSLEAEDPDLGSTATSIDLVINFDYDKDTMKTDSVKQAAELAAAVQAMAGKRFRLVGHTDRNGDVRYNDGLSLRRAASVRAFLLSRGVSASRLEVEGRGERNLLNRQETPEADAVNRRVEVQVIP